MLLDVDRPPCFGCLRTGDDLEDGSLLDIVKAMDIDELLVRCDNGFDGNGLENATQVLVKKTGEIVVVE